MSEGATGGRKNPFIALLLAWLVPGAGHWYLGRREKAVLFFSVLILLFGAGFLMGELRNVTLRDHPYYFIGQIFLGLPTVVAMFLTA
ncbi:MAG: hypothetical protein QF464_15775, partial [Myxococcota bacterium]|nr:hypothetical protein [Myxococcota bacterium]